MYLLFASWALRAVITVAVMVAGDNVWCFPARNVALVAISSSVALVNQCRWKLHGVNVAIVGRANTEKRHLLWKGIKEYVLEGAHWQYIQSTLLTTCMNIVKGQGDLHVKEPSTCILLSRTCS
jgi:hypothetical protein